MTTRTYFIPFFVQCIVVTESKFPNFPLGLPEHYVKSIEIKALWGTWVLILAWALHALYPTTFAKIF